MRRVLGWVCLAMLWAPPAAARCESWLYLSLLQARQIVCFERDPETGDLTRRSVTDCEAEPAFLQASRDGRFLFVSLRSSGELASYRINPRSGELALVSRAAGGEDPAYLLPDRSGRFLLAAYYVANQVTVHRVGPDGGLSAQPIQTVKTAEKAHGLAIDSRNSMVFVPHTGANRIHQFRFAADVGRLTPSEPPFLPCPAGREPRHLVLSPDDRWAFSSDEAGDTISAYAVDRDSATLQPRGAWPTIPANFDGRRNATARCQLTPDGRFAYVANRGHDSLAGFSIDAATGELTPLEVTPTEPTPRSFAIDPRGRFLYAAGQSSGRIAVFRILEDGRLRRTATCEGGAMAWAVAAVDASPAHETEQQ